MKLQVSDRMKSYEEGIFQILNEKKEEVEKSGRKVYNLSVGTPDFPTEPHIIEAVTEASKDPANYKYSLKMLPELIEAVIDRFEKRYHVKLSEKEITDVYGSQEGIAHIGLSLCNPDEIVLVPDPGYPIFSIGPSLAMADVRTYELKQENDYLPKLSEIKEEILRKTKFMIVSYPLNPICKIAPDSFYEELIPWAKAHDIIIVHDNAYSDIIYDGHVGKSILQFEGAKENCVEFYSLSKSYCYTGARVGFLVGNEYLVQNFKKLRSQIDYGTFLPVQYGAIAALKGSDEGVYKRCAKYQERRDALCGGLRKIGWDIPDSEGTMFAWGKIPEGYSDDVAFVMELLEKSGVLCTPGSSFGKLGKGHVRFALTMPVEEIKKAVKAVADSGMI
ncbi:aminotransferase class I/II-fold pyridoxal phosphate-dependent enzyme [Parablautia muri]|uniref:Aminotransferase class I/II-fold pyridoxal phosphate-dependent enzyme n=1 Tax=Parablautia muri TaxID=2320879 RepID=A0A9X5BHQ5_9FIRM|nr:aminotransferase class I/II-fold pyridoxal phosphate-dependent enzyme [Parablautia muri]NBJ94290.1 aminotransferase class I/II-fold pyridoxal phosphate-dependent enzyme [Parablautia muri]